jgi:NAD(P)H-quinone oxidoreductase subunit 5
MGKCAQFPMHLWLDEAMEGPNPASILRNSVVVTCGAVVLLKVMPLLRISPVAIDVLLVVGTISAVGGALVAIAQVDLKRACSYSTTSYLGLVFVAIALQQPFIALLLLFAHAVAKAVLFMSVGSVIATTNCQDLTELGGLANRMPATTTAFLVGAAGLTGLLPLGCFWSFGLMVEDLTHRAPLFAVVVLLTNALTALNLTRVYRQVFLGSPHPKTRRAPEVNWLMALPMVSLSVLVLLTPLVMARIDRVPGIDAFSSGTALVLVGSGVAGWLAGSLVPLDTFWSRSLLQPLRLLQDLLAFDFYTDRIYRATIVAFVAGMARITNGFDRLVVNGLVNRIADVSMASAQTLKLGVSGRLQTYVFTVVVAIVLLVGSLSWLGG